MPARLFGATRTAVTVTAACALVVAGSTAAAGAATPHTRPTLAVHVTSKHQVSAPNAQRPGLVHLKNTATGQLGLFRKKHKGVADLVAEANSSGSAGVSALYRDFGIVDLIGAHADEYVHLAKGTYFLVDATTDKLKASQVHTITVSGTTVNAPTPHSTLLQVAANGHVTGSTSMAKRAYAHLVNRAGSPRAFSLVSIAKTATAKQINAVIADPAHHSPFTLTGSYFGILGLLAGHTDVYKQPSASAGRYFVLAASLTSSSDKVVKGQVGLVTLH